MVNVLRCSIIFMILHTFTMNFGLAVNPMYNKGIIRQQNRLDSIFSDEPDGQDMSRLKSQNSLTGFNNYDFDDYYHGGEEELDSNQNTHSVDSDYDDGQYDDESLMTADKRSRHVPRRQGKRTDGIVDLCPITTELYQIREKHKNRGFRLRFHYNEIACNHTRTHHNYDRQYNRICYSLGRTFEYGHGTHCVQRFIVKEIEIESITGDNSEKYTETNFRYGCTCGWATDELGLIDDYHYNKILNLCSEIRDRD